MYDAFFMSKDQICGMQKPSRNCYALKGEDFSASGTLCETFLKKSSYTSHYRWALIVLL